MLPISESHTSTAHVPPSQSSLAHCQVPGERLETDRPVVERALSRGPRDALLLQVRGHFLVLVLLRLSGHAHTFFGSP